MPNFGQFRDKLHEVKQEVYKKFDLLENSHRNGKVINVIPKEHVVKIKDVIGHALDKIGAYNDLNNREQVVALIDEVCLN